MPGCAAIGCNNRSEKGYSMKCFPRDPVLRQMWKERVGRANWEPSKNSFLCHDHFEIDQWAETESGKVRLKRDAMPSIFKETSTRKSPRKRRLENGQQSSSMARTVNNSVRVTAVKMLRDESDDDNYTLEYLDDGEYEVAFTSVGHMPKIHSVRSLTTNLTQESMGNQKNNYELAYHIISEKDMRALEKENIIIVSDENNREIGKLIHNNENMIIVADENNKEIGQVVVEEDPLGQSDLEANIREQENYDEIEEKLKQICNGEDVAVTLLSQRERAGLTADVKNEIGSKNELITRRDVIAETADSKLDEEVGGNIKFIFGTASDDEDRNTRDTNLQQKILEQKASLVNNETGTTIIKKKTSGVAKTRDLNPCSLNKALQRRETRLTAPCKRPKRTKEDVMTSIERAILKLSERTLQSVQNEQLTRSILSIPRARQKRHNKGRSRVSHPCKKPSEMIEDTFELSNGDSSSKKSKFTIKVTGVADDVSEIIEDLETCATKIKTDSDKEEESHLNYIIAKGINERELTRIHRRFIKGQERCRKSLKSGDGFSTDFDSIDLAEEGMVGAEYANTSKNLLYNIKHGTSDIDTLFKHNEEFIHTEEFETKLQGRKLLTEEKRRIKIEEPSSSDENKHSLRLTYSSKSQDPSREMRQKINVQQEVIRKLTDQLIIYKGLEAKLANLGIQLQVKNKEIQVLKDKLAKTSDQFDCKKDEDMKEKTISDLSNKVNRLREANKKLMQQIASESQNRKLGYHLKQKDEQIKELNWKLEKASKFLERAEKNANTYKRKMVSMQTAIRRQKASEEKRNHFQELLIDNAKHEFSESALLTAMDIRNSCGIKCYQKLLSYNFPLPSLRTLRRRFQKENLTEDDWGDEDQELEVNTEDYNDATNTEVCQSNELGVTEVTGTVQDIFEENNDTEELNSSELGEQIFLQLNNEKKYTDT